MHHYLGQCSQKSCLVPEQHPCRTWEPVDLANLCWYWEKFLHMTSSVAPPHCEPGSLCLRENKIKVDNLVPKIVQSESHTSCVELALFSCGSGGGGQGGHAPPVPVKTSHKKDGRHRRPLIFHVSWPPPSDHAGSDAVIYVFELHGVCHGDDNFKDTEERW